MSSEDKLMISVSGIRGVVGRGLTPEVVLRYAQAYGAFVGDGKVVVGRDSRVTGEMVKHAVLSGLMSVGRDVIDIGLVPTPTTQMAVEKLDANGGIIITASHNPIEWNALKLLANDGLFLDAEQGDQVGRLAASREFTFAEWDGVGKVETYGCAVEDHLDAIEQLELVDVSAIKRKRFRVIIDCCNGAGGVILPALCERLGCEAIFLNQEPNGLFPRNPEPVPANLTELCDAVKREQANVGFAVDPDVDRLAIVSEKGVPLGEDYTLVIATELVFAKRAGKVVINASTTRAIDDIAARHNSEAIRTKVGEIHVAKRAREVGAVLAGEGNGGVILPDLHLGRDAPLGIALTLQLLAEFGGTVSALHDTLPRYRMVKDRIPLPPGKQPVTLVEMLRDRHASERLDLTDGLKILRDDSWVHVRPSNTEPIIRIIAEAPKEALAKSMVQDCKDEISTLAGDK